MATMGGIEQRLPGGNVGGAWLVGSTVRRTTGPWTPAVHALLKHLAGRLRAVPGVHGVDEQGREILDYLPGRIVDVDSERLSVGQLQSLVGWTRDLHQATAGFAHPGPWRYFTTATPTVTGHNDIAPYNVCFGADSDPGSGVGSGSGQASDVVVGVFDWDLAGPTTPVLELAFLAWNCVPLWEDAGRAESAARLRVIASAYADRGAEIRAGLRGVEAAAVGCGLTGDAPSAAAILRTVPARIQLMLDWIPAAAAAGDVGMAHLLTVGEPERSQRSLNKLCGRLPAIAALLD